MKSSVKKCLLIEILLGLSALFNFIFHSLFNHDKHIIFLCLALLITFLSLGIDIRRNGNDKAIIRNILITYILHIVMYYCTYIVIIKCTVRA